VTMKWADAESYCASAGSGFRLVGIERERDRGAGCISCLGALPFAQPSFLA